MARKLVQTAYAQVRGNADYSAAQGFRVAFGDVTEIGRGLNSACRKVVLIADMVCTHDNAGAVSVPERLFYRTFDMLQLRGPDGHVFLNLTQQGGCVMRELLYHASGRRPNAHGGGGAVSLPNGANTAVRLKLELPIGYLYGAEDPDDANVDLAELLPVAIEGKWANGAAGGVFDSGANNERIVSGTVRAYVTLVGRDEAFRGGVRVSIESVEMSGVNEEVDQLKNAALHGMVELPVHADGITENFVTDAERDLITLHAEDGHPLLNAIDARDQQTDWNMVKAESRAEEVAHHETDASPFVSLFHPSRKPYKLTELPQFRKKGPKLIVTGSDATPRVAWIASELHSAARVQGRLEAAKADPSLPNTTKTLSKSDSPNPSAEVTQVLPFKISA